MDDLPEIKASMASTLGSVTMTADATVRSPISDDHHYYALIGRVTARWAQFEHALDIAIWAAMKVDQAAGSAITSKLRSHAARFDALRKELRASGWSGLVSQVDTLEAKAGAVSEGRHRITHDPWYVGNLGDVTQLRSTLQKAGGLKYHFGFVEVPASELEYIHKQIDEIIEGSQQIWLSILSANVP